MPTFVGLDLAWKPENESGLSWLEGDSPENQRCTRLEPDDPDIDGHADELAAIAGTVVVSIDAPVLYTPARWVDTYINRVFGRFNASAHSAHYAYREGRRAGIELGYALANREFTLDPRPLLDGNRECRLGLEVYPHTLHVRLFELKERILYKYGKKPLDVLRPGMQQYQSLLRDLLQREAPRVLEHSEILRVLDHRVVESAIGKDYKRVEDSLDGVTCAVSAWLMWNEPKRWELLGDMGGYIVVPRESQPG
ncbi:MAG: DUF429 domain-containing protein [Chloroflexi bacterium]|nr:DUF429 domain-containing protein [Chloroflexota bacterium]